MISTVGIVAMLWVGGHILLVNSAEVGLHWPYDTVHHWEEAIHDAVHGVVGSVLAWLANTGVSAVIGVVWGGLVVAVMHVLPDRQEGRRRGRRALTRGPRRSAPRIPANGGRPPTLRGSAWGDPDYAQMRGADLAPPFPRR